MAQPNGHDWYLREWFAMHGLKQRDLVTKLDYQPGSAHRMWHGLQQYRREDVDAVSALLNIRPFELMMPPEEAMAIRRLRTAIAEVQLPPEPQQEAPATRTGTDG